MKTINMHGCGNTFTVVDDYLAHFYDRFGFRFEDSVAKGSIDSLIDDFNIGIAENMISDSSFVPDGFLFVLPAENADFRMKYYDIDRSSRKASRFDMCGNGIRCLARYVSDVYLAGPNMRILTDDGVKNVYVSEDVEVNMGKPREFCILDDAKRIYFVNSGLPHLVFLKDHFDIHDKSRLDAAKKFCGKTAFDKGITDLLGYPGGVHVNIASIKSKKCIDLVTYEPGVGDFTKACGTGSTASAYVASVVGGLKFPIVVSNRGGDLNIDFKEGNLFMAGPAEYLSKIRFSYPPMFNLQLNSRF